MATAPPLGAAASFAVLGGTTVTNTGATTIVGDVGVSPGTSITGFPPGTVSGGTLHANDATSVQAEADTATAYGILAGEAVDTSLSGQNLGGLTLTPGVYNFSSTAQLDGNLTFDAQGNSNAVFVIQVGTSLTTGTGAAVLLIDGARSRNIFWQVGSSATLGTGTSFEGSILAFTSITLNTGASISPGRALAINGAVTMDTNAISSVFTTPLTITADNQTKAYGAALPALTVTYTGFINGDTSASLTTQPTLTTTATAASHVGTYAITAAGAVDPDYVISYVDGSLAVTPAPLTITADGQTKAYGAALPTLTTSYSGFVNGDTPASLTTQPTLTTTATAASHVGTYAITAAGAVDSDYTISYVDGSLAVTAAPLTITADDQTKAYGAAVPPLTVTYTGFTNGDTSASLTTQPTVTTTATAASHVGTYAITVSGAVDPDYTISYVAGNLAVTAAPLTITADNKTKAYGAALPPLTASYAGFVNGDTSANLTTQPTLTTTATAASHVGTFAITAAGADGGPDYAISYVNGTLAVTAAPLTITADNKTKAYGAALPPLTASYAGFVNGDTPASLTTLPSLTTTATAASQVGPDAITASGAADPDYTISYVAGTLTVVPPTVAVGGTVFLDLDATGTIAANDPGMAGRVVYVDLHGDGILHAEDPQAVTDAAGNFTIAGLPPGQYSLRVKTFPNDDPTGPGGNQIALTLIAGQDVSGANFGLQPGSTVVPRTPTPDRFAGGTTTQGAVIESLYRTLLGRQGEAAGISFWTGRSQAGESYSAIATDFLNSAEYRSDVIESYYGTFLGRAAEPAGLAFWLSAFGAGYNETQISEAFLASPEYVADHADPSDYVESLYTNLLGREASAPEVAAWDQHLAGGMTRAAVAAGVVESTEAYLRGIEGDYTAFLGRVGEAPGIAYWLNLVQRGKLTLAGVEANFFDSPEIVTLASQSL